MVAEIQYGGRVTDELDRLVLNALTATWIGEHVMAPTATFKPDIVLDDIPGDFEYRWAFADIVCSSCHPSCTSCVCLFAVRVSQTAELCGH